MLLETLRCVYRVGSTTHMWQVQDDITTLTECLVPKTVLQDFQRFHSHDYVGNTQFEASLFPCSIVFAL